MIRDTSKQDSPLEDGVKSKWPRYLIISVLFMAVASIVYAVPQLFDLFDADRSVRKSDLRFAVVERGTVTQDVAVQGKVIAINSPTIFAPSEGIVSLHVKVGDVVTNGQVIASILSPELLSRSAQEEAKLSELTSDVKRHRIQWKTDVLNAEQTTELAKVNLEVAEKAMTRARDSIDANVMSMVEFDQFEVALKKAQLEFRHAGQKSKLKSESLGFELETKELQLGRQQFLVDDLHRQIEELQLVSPIEKGVVGSISVREKDAVSRNAILMTVVDTTAFEIEIDIPESYADNLSIGLASRIGLDGNDHDGVLASISPEVVSGFVRGRVRFSGEAPSGLRQNRRVAVHVLIGTREDTLKVKRGPFVESGGGRIAFVIRDSVAERRSIVLGSRSLKEVEILSGLEVGDQVIVSSIEDYADSERLYISR